jgi:hypothetical protein
VQTELVPFRCTCVCFSAGVLEAQLGQGFGNVAVCLNQRPHSKEQWNLHLLVRCTCMPSHARLLTGNGECTGSIWWCPMNCGASSYSKDQCVFHCNVAISLVMVLCLRPLNAKICSNAKVLSVAWQVQTWHKVVAMVWISLVWMVVGLLWVQQKRRVASSRRLQGCKMCCMDHDFYVFLVMSSDKVAAECLKCDWRASPTSILIMLPKLGPFACLSFLRFMMSWCSGNTKLMKNDECRA